MGTSCKCSGALKPKAPKAKKPTPVKPTPKKGNPNTVKSARSKALSAKARAKALSKPNPYANGGTPNKCNCTTTKSHLFW